MAQFIDPYDGQGDPAPTTSYLYPLNVDRLLATSVAEGSSKQVILINGNQLVQLMIDHNVGVSVGNFYQLKEVDMDYFAIDEAVDAD